MSVTVSPHGWMSGQGTAGMLPAGRGAVGWWGRGFYWGMNGWRTCPGMRGGIQQGGREPGREREVSGGSKGGTPGSTASGKGRQKGKTPETKSKE